MGILLKAAWLEKLLVMVWPKDKENVNKIVKLLLLKILWRRKKIEITLTLHINEDIWGKNATVTILRSLRTKSSSMCARPGYGPGP